MSNATKQDITDLQVNLDKKITDLQVNLDKKFEDVMGVLHTFMAQVDQRFNKVETDISDIRISLDRLTNTLDGFLKRLDDIETEQTARDAQFARLVEWAKQVSIKTGIPLKDL